MTHRSKRDSGRIVAILLFILLITFGTIYFSSKYLAHYLFKQVLSSVDFNVDEIEDLSLSFSSISFSGFKLSPLKEDQCCEVSIRGLLVKEPFQTFVDKNKLEISVSEIDLELSSSQGESDSSSIELPKTFPNISLDIGLLTLSDVPIPSNYISFSGKIDSNPLEINLSGKLNSSDSKIPLQIKLNTDGKAIIEISDANLNLNSITAKGISGKLGLEVLDKIRSTETNEFVITSINGPIELLNNRFNLNVDSSKHQGLFELRNVTLNTFGGQLSIKNLPISKLPGPISFPVKLKNIDLQSLLEFIEQEQIDATGNVSGKLPVHINGDKISIKNGQLWAEKPGGYIKYLGPENVLGESPQMIFAMSALKNLNYSTLKADVTYKPDGTLILGTSIEGKNKEMNIARPINVNLNVEQNVLKLLESLHAVDNFTKIKGK